MHMRKANMSKSEKKRRKNNNNYDCYIRIELFSEF